MSNERILHALQPTFMEYAISIAQDSFIGPIPTEKITRSFDLALGLYNWNTVQILTILLVLSAFLLLIKGIFPSFSTIQILKQERAIVLPGDEKTPIFY